MSIAPETFEHRTLQVIGNRHNHDDTKLIQQFASLIRALP